MFTLSLKSSMQKFMYGVGFFFMGKVIFVMGGDGTNNYRDFSAFTHT